MRLTWLDNLAKHHNEWKRWDEAAQAHLLSASLIAQYHHALNSHNPPLHPDSFQRVCPNVKREPAIGPIANNQFQVSTYYLDNTLLISVRNRYGALKDSSLIWTVLLTIS